MKVILKLKKDNVLISLLMNRKTYNFNMYFSKRIRRRKRKVTSQKTKRQTGSFLNLYDFAYARRDTLNQAAKFAPGIIKGATNEINNIAKQRIDQIVSQGGKEVEHVFPKILRGAIEDVYQAAFRLLGDLRKKQLNKLKKKKFKIGVPLFYFYIHVESNNNYIIN